MAKGGDRRAPQIDVEGNAKQRDDIMLDSLRTLRAGEADIFAPQRAVESKVFAELNDFLDDSTPDASRRRFRSEIASAQIRRGIYNSGLGANADSRASLEFEYGNRQRAMSLGLNALQSFRPLYGTTPVSEGYIAGNQMSFANQVSQATLDHNRRIFERRQQNQNLAVMAGTAAFGGVVGAGAFGAESMIGAGGVEGFFGGAGNSLGITDFEKGTFAKETQAAKLAAAKKQNSPGPWASGYQL